MKANGPSDPCGTTWCRTPSRAASGAAIAVVAVEQLQDARRCACRADPLLDTFPVDGIDHPDATVVDEGVRAPLHELVDDPAEATVELVAEADLHRCHIAAQLSRSWWVSGGWVGGWGGGWVVVGGGGWVGGWVGGGW